MFLRMIEDLNVLRGDGRSGEYEPLMIITQGTHRKELLSVQ